MVTKIRFIGIYWQKGLALKANRFGQYQFIYIVMYCIMEAAKKVIFFVNGLLRPSAPPPILRLGGEMNDYKF